LDEIASYWIFEDVPRDSNRIFVISEYVLEVASLPECCSISLLPRKRRSLLEDTHELTKVSSRMISFDQYVDVIGHEAVRNNHKTLIAGRTR